MNKARELQKIAREIEKCSICRTGKSGKAVPGEGNSNAESAKLFEDDFKKLKSLILSN